MRAKAPLDLRNTFKSFSAFPTPALSLKSFLMPLFCCPSNSFPSAADKKSLILAWNIVDLDLVCQAWIDRDILGVLLHAVEG